MILYNSDIISKQKLFEFLDHVQILFERVTTCWICGCGRSLDITLPEGKSGQMWSWVITKPKSSSSPKSSPSPKSSSSPKSWSSPNHHRHQRPYHHHHQRCVFLHDLHDDQRSPASTHIIAIWRIIISRVFEKIGVKVGKWLLLDLAHYKLHKVPPNSSY